MTPYHAGPPSDHFDGFRFHNLYAPTIDRRLRDIWAWKRHAAAARWPPRLRHVPQDHPPQRSDALRIACVGHASLLIQVAGHTLLLDPVWSERASPLAFRPPPSRPARHRVGPPAGHRHRADHP